MTALTGRRSARIAAVLSGTALTVGVVAGLAGAASAQPLPTVPGHGPIQVAPAVPANPGAPARPSQPFAPGEPIICSGIDGTGPVVITPHEGDGPWVTIERELPADAVPATPLDDSCVVASVR